MHLEINGKLAKECSLPPHARALAALCASWPLPKPPGWAAGPALLPLLWKSGQSAVSPSGQAASLRQHCEDGERLINDHRGGGSTEHSVSQNSVQVQKGKEG